VNRRVRLLPAAALAFALLAAPAFGPAALAGEKTVKPSDVTDDIICPCDCGEVLTGCICELGIEMKGIVETSLKEGKSKEQIQAAFVAKYGEVVLGAPKAKGFNLIVWVAPFLATLAGFVMVAFILRRWTARKQAIEAAGVGAGAVPGAASGAGPTPETDLDTLRARAEEEIRRLQAGGGR
jgi:cytochrome c-type biogenesis protein CcmH/NrfF